MLGTYGHSLVCHTFCDMGDSFLMVISQDPTLTHNAEYLVVELSLPVYNKLGMSRLRFLHKTFRLGGEHSNPLRHRRGPDTFSDRGLCNTLSFICL